MDNMAEFIPRSNVYPTAGGDTLGEMGSAIFSPDDQGGVATNSYAAMISRAAAVGASGEPRYWWITIIVLFVGAMWVSQKYGDGTFANVKLTLHNVLAIGVASLIFISTAKVVFTRFPVPGLTSVVMAA